MNLKYILPLVLFLHLISCQPSKSKVLVGAYYFDGWAGKTSKTTAVNNPPTHLTQALATTYSGREPLWGWRDDDVEIMERQIDLAADNGIDFFVFCWYWAKDGQTFDKQFCENKATNTSIQLFLKARNRKRMKFAILVANHKGAQIKGEDNWKQAVSYLSDKFFCDSQYLKIDGRPYLSVFLPKECVAYTDAMREEAKRHGLEGLYLVSCGSEQSGFDMMTWYNIRLKEHGCSEKRTYKELVDNAEARWANIPTNTNFALLVMAGWDRRPWESEGDEGVYCIGRKPKLLRKHLTNAVNVVKNRSSLSNKMVLIYAWNELGEGGYLIPTKEDTRYKYLRAVDKVKK